MGYKFDPEVEYPTVKIRVNPTFYVAIETPATDEYGNPVTDDKGNPQWGRKMLAPDKVIKTFPDGKDKWVWGFSDATMWVTPKIAQELTTVGGQNAKMGLSPLATILETRATPGVPGKPTKAPETDNTVKAVDKATDDRIKAVDAKLIAEAEQKAKAAEDKTEALEARLAALEATLAAKPERARRKPNTQVA